MPTKELIGKVTAFSVVALSLIVAGILTLLGPHAYNDDFNTLGGASLVLGGLATGAIGALMILGVLRDAHHSKHAHDVHVTPREAGPTSPPPWGMGEIGRPGHLAMVDGAEQTGLRGGGSPRVVAVRTSGLDMAVFIGVLLVWTTFALIWFAPR